MPSIGMTALFPLVSVYGIEVMVELVGPEPYSISVAILMASLKSFGLLMIKAFLNSGLTLSIR